MVRYEDWTEKLVKKEPKKNSANTSESWRTVAQDQEN